MPFCGPLLIFSPDLKHWGPPDGRGYVANPPACGPQLILVPELKCWVPPNGRCYVANVPICEPHVIFSPHFEALETPLDCTGYAMAVPPKDDSATHKKMWAWALWAV